MKKKTFEEAPTFKSNLEACIELAKRFIVRAEQLKEAERVDPREILMGEIPEAVALEYGLKDLKLRLMKEGYRTVKDARKRL